MTTASWSRHGIHPNRNFCLLIEKDVGIHWNSDPDAELLQSLAGPGSCVPRRPAQALCGAGRLGNVEGRKQGAAACGLPSTSH